ncbi:hypothetical protein [Desulfomicrobium escambiense]|uniref:VgrG-related protein n=1 Tax=Desulfomicrobium escambiense TaxID=29503 RepID=UPI00042A4470|nr:hypothetical protein [Desulfomicrobium escambiense]
MSLIDPIQLMTMLGTAPERQSRPAASADRFQSHMRQAMDGGDTQALGTRLGGSGMDNSLMQSALNGLASLMRQPPATAGGKGAADAHAGIGELSAAFESGTEGVSAIGYDKNGGTSYGTYQIASKPGTMKEFIEFLKDREPDWAAKLKGAGAANTGSTKGRMPDAWRSIAEQDPEKFGRLQREFIESTHYEPAKDKILSRTGMNVDELPAAAREALWSTAVQHGPAGAARIFSRAIKSIDGELPENRFAQKLIDKVYENRKAQFGSSTATVQASVRGRMNTEKEMVLAMLQGEDARA